MTEAEKAAEKEEKLEAEPKAEEPEEPEADAAEEDDDEPPPITRGQAFFRMSVVTIALLVFIELIVRTAFHFHRKGIETAAAADYPADTFIGDFNAKVDYRFINFYTIDPARGNNAAYDFDKFGFRLDARKLRFDAPMAFKQIWLLGGSTVQGLGVVGDDTISAHLNTLLEKDHSQYRVINMGQGGFTSTQELLLLIELLQAGHKPDVLISYDGATEVPFATDLEKNGTPEWEKRTAKTALLLDIQGDESIGTLLPFTLSRMTRIDDVMRSLVRRMNPAANSGAFEAANWDVVARKHLATLNLIKAAADQQKAPSFFFFQPILQYDDHYKTRKLSPEEDKLRAKTVPDEYKRREAVFGDALAELRKGLGDHFFDIHDVFRGHDGERMYADARHPNGAGNTVIAARIYDEIKKLPAQN